MKKRIFAALLCVIMLFGMLPVRRWQQTLSTLLGSAKQVMRHSARL